MGSCQSYPPHQLHPLLSELRLSLYSHPSSLLSRQTSRTHPSSDHPNCLPVLFASSLRDRYHSVLSLNKTVTHSPTYSLTSVFPSSEVWRVPPPPYCDEI